MGAAYPTASPCPPPPPPSHPPPPLAPAMAIPTPAPVQLPATTAPPTDDCQQRPVQFEEQEDPHNWSDRKRWGMVGLVSLMGFISPLGSSITVAGSKSLEEAMNLASRLLATVPVSTYLVGLAFGPFFFAPASELVGRRPVYVLTSVAFVALNAGTALAPNYAALVVLRFLAGVAGSTGPTLGSGVIGDMFAPRFRGRAVAVYGLGPLLGPVVGNLISGYISEASHSFRWLLWTLTIISGAISVAIIALLQETFGPVLLDRKRQSLAGVDMSRVARTKRTLNSSVRPWTWHNSPAAKEKFRLAMSRPFRLLFCNPICAIFSIYQGFVYGVMFVFLTQHPLLFQQRQDVSSSSLSDSGSGVNDPASQHLAHPLPLWPRQQPQPGNGSGDGSDHHNHRLGSNTHDPNLNHLPSYGWSMGNAGLSYLGLGVGFLIAMCINALVNDWMYRRLVATEGKLTRNLLNPRVRLNQLAQEADIRAAAHEVIHGSRPASVRSAPSQPLPTHGVPRPSAARDDPEAAAVPADEVPAYTEEDSIRPVSLAGSNSVSSTASRDNALTDQNPADDDIEPKLDEKSTVDPTLVNEKPDFPAVAPPASDPPQPQRKGQPEFRLPLCLLGMIILPCGLCLFGWSASAKTHWSIPLLGSMVTGMGTILCFQTILMYLVDAFIPYSASATACSVLVRSILAAAFPLFAESLYARLGYGGGSSLLAGIAVLGLPVPIVMFLGGQRLRERFKFNG